MDTDKVNVTHSFQVTPPESFTFSSPANWSKWITRFERYRIASGLNKQSDIEQINSFIYIMGEQAEDIFTSFQLSSAEAEKFEVVLKKFNDHFVVKKNIVFERAQFNKRVQLEGERVNDFITALYRLAESCEYGSLHDELIRDRIVVGIRDKALSEKLQLDSELTLTKVIEKVRLSETIKQQQRKLGEDETVTSLNIMRSNKIQHQPDNFQNRKERKFNAKGTLPRNFKSSQKDESCKWCGKQKHEKSRCPARDAKCRKCSKVGHYEVVCLSKNQAKSSAISFLGIVLHAEKVNNDWTVYVKVQNQDLKFKIDTGADHTAISAAAYHSLVKKPKLEPVQKVLCGPDSSPLKVLGKFNARLNLKDKCCKEEIYVIDGLQTSLLGKPALISFGLGPNLSNLDQVVVSNPKEEFPELFEGLGLMKSCYSIKLKADSVPYAVTSPRRVPIPLLKKTEDALKKMVEQKVITPVTEPTEWCSPVVIVPKKDGQLRICVDLTELNRNVLRELHPLPNVEYTLSLLSGAKIFSKLDANSGFWQIPLDEKSSFLTTFIMPFGRFMFLRLPFGISSAPEHFQRRMSQILENLSGIACHMDDILIWGSTQEEHDQRLREVCKRLKDANLTLNEKKCIFSTKSIKFLGHIIDSQGIHPDDEKVKAVKEYKPPRNKKELKQLLGFANYLARFVPNYAEIMYPLTSMLSNKREFVWDHPQKNAFQEWQKILSSDPVLKIFDPNKESIVTTDASSYGLGATLRQKLENGKTYVVAYASRTLTPAESRYAQIEKEALAVAWGCEKFKDYLTGSHFLIETDHKPLIPILSRKHLDDLSPRLQRIRLRMMRYSYTITHVPGKMLYAADALSRNPRVQTCENDELGEEIDAYIQMITNNLPATSNRLKEFQEAQQADETCQKLTSYVLTGWPSKKDIDRLCLPFWQHRFEISIQDGLLMRGCRIIIPKSLQAEVLNKIHEGHLGITKCRARARCSVYWPKINNEIEERVKNCPACIKESSNRHEPLLPTPFPERPWQVVGLDLFKYNNSWYLLIADYYSRYPEVSKLDTLTSEEIINHCKSIFSRHGIPEILRTDNGPQFDPVKTRQFIEFAKSYGFTHITNSPKFSQSNGFVESSVKTVKMRIKKSADPYIALMEYRATPLENGYSPAELLMGRRIRTILPISSAQLLPKIIKKADLEGKEKRRMEKQRRNYNRRHGTRDLSELEKGQGVWMTDKRLTGKVLEKTPFPRSYIIQSGKRIYRRNRKHLIPSPDFEPEPDEPDEGFEIPEDNHPSDVLQSGIKSPVTSKLQGNSSPKSTLPPRPTIKPYVTRSGRTVRPPQKLDL